MVGTCSCHTKRNMWISSHDRLPLDFILVFSWDSSVGFVWPLLFFLIFLGCFPLFNGVICEITIKKRKISFVERK